MSQTKVRVSKELYDKLNEIAKRQNTSIRELVDRAIKVYLYGLEGEEEKAIKRIQGKIIQVNYPSRCRVCGRQIEKGELAYYVRTEYEDNSSKSYLICLNCYYKDTALANMYLRKKQLERIIKGLKKMADSYASKVEKLKVQAELYSLKNETIRLLETVIQYIRDNPTNIQRVYELKENIEELSKKLDELEAELKLVTDTHKIVSVKRGYEKWVA